MYVLSWSGVGVYVVFFNDTAPPEIYPLSLRDALPICFFFFFFFALDDRNLQEMFPLPIVWNVSNKKTRYILGCIHAAKADCRGRITF